MHLLDGTRKEGVGRSCSNSNLNSNSNTRSFHLVNVALHALVVQLVAILGRYELHLGHRHTLIMALYFATHPIHTEAVSLTVLSTQTLFISLYIKTHFS